MKPTAAEMHTLMSPLIGLAPWRAGLGHGTMLTFEFGRSVPRRDNERREHGEYHLWVYNCAWRIESRQTVVAGSRDDETTMASAARNLQGRRVESIELLDPTLDCVMTFEGASVMRLFAVSKEEQEHWMLFLPGGDVLIAGPGSEWSYGPRVAPTDE